MNYLVRIEGHYFFRARIPKDLYRIFHRKEVKKSLHTRSLANAKVIAKAYSYRLERIYTIARGRMLTDAEIQKRMRDFLTDSLRDFEEGRSINPAEHDNEKLRKAYLLMAEEGRKGLARNDITDVRQWLDGLIEDKGLKVSKDSMEYHCLGRELLKVWQVFWKVLAEREIGNYDNDYDRITQNLTRPSYVQPDEQQQGRQPIGVTLSQAFGRYIQQQEDGNAWSNPIKGKKQAEYVKEQSLKMLGDKDIGRYTRQNALDYRATWRVLPLEAFTKKGLKELSIADKIKKAEILDMDTVSVRTVNEYTRIIAAAIDTCKHDGPGMTSNPFEDLKIRNDVLPEDQWQAYTTEDIKALLASPIYTTDRLKTCAETPHQFWIPLLALFTGARMNELCSLFENNVIGENGIFCIEIVRDKKTKRVKTKSSERIIPIHQVLLDTGFMRYVEKVRRSGEADGQLWPLLKHAPSTGYAGAFNQWFGNHINRKYITQEDKKTFRSFRRTFITALSECNVDDPIIDRLDGHAATGTGRRYGKGSKTVETLYEEGIKKLDYKGIDFSGIKAPV